MVNRSLISFLTLALAVLTIDSARGQVTPRPFAIRDSHNVEIDIAHFIIKGDNKSHEFKGDSSSADYKSLSGIDPNWIKDIEVLKNEQLQGGTQTTAIITLKKGKLKKLPDDMRNKFE